MNIFMDAFTDSRMVPMPPINRNVAIFLPLTASPGIIHIAINKTLIGMKQAINNVEIITTILATLWLRCETPSVCWKDAEFCRHFVFCWSLNTRTIVQTLIAKNAAMGITVLLTVYDGFSTASLFGEWIKPITVLFLEVENFRPSLLMA